MTDSERSQKKADKTRESREKAGNLQLYDIVENVAKCRQGGIYIYIHHD